MNNLSPILEQAIDIAESASRVALSYFRQALLIEVKDNGTPVTQADKKTEVFIRDALATAFPDFGVIGEEMGEEKKKSHFTWTVDPIDGTRSFIRGVPLFGTLLGLLENKEPVLGVMVLPALKETYAAARGTGAFCNGTQIHVAQTKQLENALISCGDVSCFISEKKKDYYDYLVDKAELVRGYTDCFGHSLVIRGAVDAMIDPLVSVWDVAPLACLIEEAGGTYYTLEGEKDIFAKSFVTSNTHLKKLLL